MESEYVLTLDSPTATLENAGGKGFSLGRLIRAGLPVPRGFHLTTSAYRAFVAATGLENEINAALAGLDPRQNAALQAASERIRKAFDRCAIPERINAELLESYAMFAGAPVAVRSSATAEDLPDASFAGQQDSFLNVCGEDELLRAVRRCWSSLWTARAIAYRAQNAIPSHNVALAVVVQEMVAAEAAGVLFSANPLNGSREEMLVNAAWGLGEGIVSGQVSPDTYILDWRSGKVIKAEVADKQVMVVQAPSGGSREAPVPAGRRKARVLTSGALKSMAELARKIQREYGQPQDIEWCKVGESFTILQSRPITRLPLCWDRPSARMAYARSSLVEYLPDPLTPLFATFGVPIANRLTLELFREMGIRNMWPEGYYTVINHYLYGSMPNSLREMLSFMTVSLKLTPKVIGKAEETWRAGVQAYAATVERWTGVNFSALTAQELLDAARDLFGAAMRYYTVFQTAGAPAAGTFEVMFTQLYSRLIRRKGDPDATVFLLGEENQALKAEKEIFAIASWARGIPDLAACLGNLPARDLAYAFHNQCMPEFSGLGSGEFAVSWDELRHRIDSYLKSFGYMIYDFDFSKILPGEDVGPLFDSIKAFLDGKSVDPLQRQQTQIERREVMSRQIKRRLDPLRRKWFEQSLRKALHFVPIREDSIAVMGMGYPQLRAAFGELGRRICAKGQLDAPGDIYWLQAGEVEEAAAALDRGETPPDFREQAAARKASLDAVRRSIPPVILPRDTWMSRMIPWKETNTAKGGVLKGIGTSAGTVTARARILLGPEDFERMQSGDVLVAPTTTPAWTALFTLAAAVVTDIGGPLSHSSIVAREYGIPAVMATGTATRIIRDGQLVTVDGTAGTVTLIEEAA